MKKKYYHTKKVDIMKICTMRNDVKATCAMQKRYPEIGITACTCETPCGYQKTVNIQITEIENNGKAVSCTEQNT